MIGRLAAFSAALALSAAPVLAAQQAVDNSGPIDLKRVDPEANLVEELIVNAKLPGPAWWKVSDADTTVYVLGVPAMTASKQTFDDSVLRRRLDGANVLIMGQEGEVSVVRMISLAVGGRKLFVMDQPMRQTLPPELRTRLEARLKVMKEEPDSMDKVKPAFAGFLVANSQDGGNISISLGGVTQHISDLAKDKSLAKRPRVQKLSDYSLVGAVKTLAEAPKPLQELCLDAGLRQAENGEAGVKRLGESWANGEVRAVVSADRGFQRCLASTPSIARELRDGRDDAVKAIGSALKTPGKAVAVIELRSLLSEDGVLEQLKAKGFTVTTPGDPTP